MFSFLLIFKFFLYSYVDGRERVVSKFLPFLYSLRTVSLFLFSFYSFHSGILFRLLNLVCHVRFPPLWAGSTLRPSFYSTLLFHTAEMERNVYRTIQQGRVVYISTTWYGAGTRVGYVTNKSSSCVSSSMPANIRLASHCLRDIRYVYEAGRSIRWRPQWRRRSQTKCSASFNRITEWWKGFKKEKKKRKKNRQK